MRNLFSTLSNCPLPFSQALATVALVALMASAPAGAVTVTYGAVDLSDAVPDDDLWRYDYTITGAFAAFDTLTIEFADGLYEQLDLTVAPTTLQAQPLLPGIPGTNSLLMLSSPSDITSLLDTASVSFVWRGAGQPGAQDFSLVADDGTVQQTGVTVLPSDSKLPEPGTWALLLAALAPGALARRARPSAPSGLPLSPRPLSRGPRSA